LVKEVAHSTNDTHVIQPYINLMQEKLVSDPMLLRNVVINLLGNAVKYSPVATPVYFGATQENENLIIEVKDLGIGISEDEQEIIFESFTRGKNVGAIRGTGLGLSIVKKAVELLGGGITVTSTVNEGSAFKVRIPLAL
jgi:signal transduction histidine kinase